MNGHKQPRLRAILLAGVIYYGLFFWIVLQIVFILRPVASADAPKAELDKPFIVKPTLRPHVLTEKEYVLSLPHGDIVWRIFGNESSFGTNPFIYCQKRGLFNDVGYNVAHKQCFSSRKEEFQSVSAWFDEELRKYTLGQALCLYNEGIAKNTCRYAEDFLSL